MTGGGGGGVVVVLVVDEADGVGEVGETDNQNFEWFLKSLLVTHSRPVSTASKGWRHKRCNLFKTRIKTTKTTVHSNSSFNFPLQSRPFTLQSNANTGDEHT